MTTPPRKKVSVLLSFLLLVYSNSIISESIAIHEQNVSRTVTALPKRPADIKKYSQSIDASYAAFRRHCLASTITPTVCIFWSTFSVVFVSSQYLKGGDVLKTNDSKTKAMLIGEHWGLPRRYEAENSTKMSNCRIGRNRKGFIERGYTKYLGSRAWIEWNNVHADSAGKHQLDVYYTSEERRGGQIIVGGSTVANISFVGTGRNQWGVESSIIQLQQGQNTIRITAREEGLALDYMEVTRFSELPQLGRPLISAEQSSNKDSHVFAPDSSLVFRQPSVEFNANHSNTIFATQSRRLEDITTCNDKGRFFELVLATDEYGGETSWTLTNDRTEVLVASGGKFPKGTQEQHIYKECLDPGQYTFTINDSAGDGICCIYGEGSYKLTLDGEIIGGGGDFGKSETTSVHVKSNALKILPTGKKILPTGKPSPPPSFSILSSVPSSTPTIDASDQPASTPTASSSSSPTFDLREPTYSLTGEVQEYNSLAEPPFEISNDFADSMIFAGEMTSTPSTGPTARPSPMRSSIPTTISFKQVRTPSSQPSLTSSYSPSTSPSPEPSKDPSGVPSLPPSSGPSSTPSFEPSSVPSEPPSSSPSVRPTRWLSTQPSHNPSSAPTLQPSSGPSPGPISIPSFKPSSGPTYNPTPGPTLDPSLSPSVDPSTSPSDHPSRVPSSSPSLDPSSHPSSRPSGSPSRSPSSRPSNLPSLEPTAEPSLEQSDAPSSSPSDIPSSTPTIKPSDSHSLAPSTSPSYGPSNTPSSRPSSKPSSEPTHIRSTSPSINPSMSPTQVEPSVACHRTGGTFFQLVVETDEYGGETSWSLAKSDTQAIVASGGKYLKGVQHQQLYSYCLNPGMYIFTIRDSAGDGICCSYGSGHYSVKLDGEVKGAGGEFGKSESIQLVVSSKGTSMVTEPKPSSSTHSMNRTQITPSTPSTVTSIPPSIASTDTPFDGPSTTPSSSPSTGMPSSFPSHGPSFFPSSMPTSIHFREAREPSSDPSTQPASIPTSAPYPFPSLDPSRKPSMHPTPPPSPWKSTTPSSIPSSRPSPQLSGVPTTISFSRARIPSSTPSVTLTNTPTEAPSFSRSTLPTGTPSVSHSAAPSLMQTLKASFPSSGKPSSPQPDLFSPHSLLQTQNPSLTSSGEPASDHNTKTNIGQEGEASVESGNNHTSTNIPITADSSSTVHSASPTFVPSSAPSSIAMDGLGGIQSVSHIPGPASVEASIVLQLDGITSEMDNVTKKIFEVVAWDFVSSDVRASGLEQAITVISVKVVTQMVLTTNDSSRHLNSEPDKKRDLGSQTSLLVGIVIDATVSNANLPASLSFESAVTEPFVEDFDKFKKILSASSKFFEPLSLDVSRAVAGNGEQDQVSDRSSDGNGGSTVTILVWGSVAVVVILILVATAVRYRYSRQEVHIPSSGDMLSSQQDHASSTTRSTTTEEKRSSLQLEQEQQRVLETIKEAEEELKQARAEAQAQAPGQPQIQELAVPAGPMGIVVESTPYGPAIISIKDSSPLAGSLIPGDLIVSFDDNNTRHMSAPEVTRLIAATSQKSQRRMTVQKEFSRADKISVIARNTRAIFMSNLEKAGGSQPRGQDMSVSRNDASYSLTGSTIGTSAIFSRGGRSNTPRVQLLNQQSMSMSLNTTNLDQLQKARMSELGQSRASSSHDVAEIIGGSNFYGSKTGGVNRKNNNDSKGPSSSASSGDTYTYVTFASEGGNDGGDSESTVDSGGDGDSTLYTEGDGDSTLFTNDESTYFTEGESSGQTSVHADGHDEKSKRRAE